MAQNNDLQPLLDVQQNQLGIQFATSDSLDTKNLGILALNVAVLLFAAPTIRDHHTVFIVLFSLIYFVSTVLNVVAIWPRYYEGTSVAVKDYPQYLKLSTRKLQLQLLADTQYASQRNARLNSIKSRLCTISIILSAVGALSLAYGIMKI